MSRGLGKVPLLVVLLCLLIHLAATSIPNVVVIVTDDQDVVLKGIVSWYSLFNENFLIILDPRRYR